MKNNITDFLTTAFGADVVAIPVSDYKKFPSIKNWQDYRDGLKTKTPTTYGINCGLSNLVVIDLDVHNENENGIESFEQLLKDYGIDSLNTLTVRTGSGGQHLYFKYDKGDIRNSVGKTGIRDGIDVRANGGQAIGPFSKVKQSDGSIGEYTIAKDAPVMDLPEWLADECRKAMSKNKDKNIPRSAVAGAAPLINEDMDNYAKTALVNCILEVSSAGAGSRNDTLARSAYGAAAAGVPVETVVDQLSAAARVNGLGEREIENTVRRCAEEGATQYVPRERTQNAYSASKKPKVAKPPIDVEALIEGASEGVAERIRRDATAELSDLLDDASLSDDFVDAEIKNRAIYLHSFKTWVFYDEKTGTWKVSAESWVRQLADKYLKARKAELLEAGLSAKAISAITSNNKLFNVSSRAAINLSEEGDVNDHFNKNQSIAIFDDGYYDFESDTFSSHSPNTRSTIRSEAQLRLGDESVDKSSFNKLIQSIPEDAVEYLQVAFGSGLVGYQATVNPHIIFLNGGGGNGKSSLLAAAQKVIGGYAKRPLSSVFEKNSDNRFAMKDFANARLAIFEELQDAHYLNAVSVKRLVGTPDASTDVKGKDTMELTIGATIFVSTNFLPTVSETDHGTWRRLMTLTFNKRYVETPDPKNPRELLADPKLSPEYIKKALPIEDDFCTAALQWFVEGARKFMANGRNLPKVPESVVTATEYWRDNNDRMANWANTYFEPATDNDFVLASDVFDCYNYHMTTIEKSKNTYTQTNFWSNFENHRWFEAKGLERKRERVGKKMTHSSWVNPVKERDLYYAATKANSTREIMIRGIKFRSPDENYDPAEARTLDSVVDETVDKQSKGIPVALDDIKFELDELHGLT